MTTGQDAIRIYANESVDIATAIFTHDDDFLSMVAKSEQQHYGVIYVHQQKLSVGECIRRLKNLAKTRSVIDMKKRIEFLWQRRRRSQHDLIMLHHPLYLLHWLTLRLLDDKGSTLGSRCFCPRFQK